MHDDRKLDQKLEREEKPDHADLSLGNSMSLHSPVQCHNLHWKRATVSSNPLTARLCLEHARWSACYCVRET